MNSSHTRSTLSRKKLPVSQLSNITLGCLGMMIIITGNLLTFLPHQKACYLVGALCMLLAALLEKQPFFIALQVIILSGTLSAYLPFESHVRSLIPLGLSFMTIMWFMRQGECQNITTRVGYFGIVMLALGYAIGNPVVYCLGGAALTHYAWHSFRSGTAIALLWAILNGIYTVSAMVSIYHYMHTH